MANAEPPHRRRSIRLPSYDYTQPGAYFITIVTTHRLCIFGDAVDDAVRLSTAGVIAEDELRRTGQLRRGVEIDAYIVMPNHVHAIVWLLDDVSRPNEQGTARRAPTDVSPRRFGKPASNSLSTIVGAYKSAVTKRVRAAIGQPAADVWQRGYYDHVIRTETALAKIREYITENPRRWSEDPKNPNRAE